MARWAHGIDAQHPFPIQNLPMGVAKLPAGHVGICIRIGDYIVDCSTLADGGLLGDFVDVDLSSLSRLDLSTALELRNRVRSLLERTPEVDSPFLVPIAEVEMRMPYDIRAFVDFYSGIHHASNVGKMFRPDMPALLPNYRHLPVAYNGRASTVCVSGTPIRRPRGQFKRPDSDAPTFGPTEELDYELEVGFFLGEGNERGTHVPVTDAESHMLGLVLVNDWSARDVQRWEYQPLGPFLAKSFATSISPWVVPMEALAPFKVQGARQEPAPLPHLETTGPAHFDIILEVSIRSARMSHPQLIARSNTAHLYWSFFQQLAHQTSNGTFVERGDLYASGTISGPGPDSFGSLLEATWRGTKPITLHETGETRSFLEDGDTVTMTGYCQAEGYRIGFGELMNEVGG